jgi:hypothetical protein
MAKSPAERLQELKDSISGLDDLKTMSKFLLYGVSGVGKTVEAAELAQKTTPENKRILYVDTGEGWVSLKNHPQLMKRTQRMTYKGLSQITDLVEAIQANLAGFDDYGTIIFDEFSTSAKQFLHLVLDANEVKSLTEAPEFKHWGILSRNIEKTLWKLLELKETHNLIFIAHERVAKNKQGIEQQAPSFMESIAASVKENMHVVARMTAEVTNREGAPEYVRKLQVHPTKMVVAKSRIGGLDIQVSPDAFNKRVFDWLESGGKLVDEKEVVALDSEKQVDKSLADQDVTFTGFEVQESETV